MKGHRSRRPSRSAPPSAEGNVTRARVVKSVPGLDEAAVKVVYEWKFKPAVKNGKPVATIANAPVAFRIGDKKRY